MKIEHNTLDDDNSEKAPISREKKKKEVIPLPGEEPEQTSEQQTKLTDVIKALFLAFGENSTDAHKTECKKSISSYLKNVLSSHPVYAKYNILILFDDTTLVKEDADKIYNAVAKFTQKKPILMVLYSRGGSAASAYLIGKLCREYAEGEFHVAVPRHAKSAATMICCAANNIHMGSLSELGPIDPQINNLPALGLKNSVEHIAELVKLYPESSAMFADYLQRSLDLIHLGFYERVAESAQQYAEKLLLTHHENLTRSEKAIASELVYKYKDHSFVIDRAEAETIFGPDIIKSNTPEYDFSNLLYTELTSISRFAGILNQKIYYVGSLETDVSFLVKTD